MTLFHQMGLRSLKKSWEDALFKFLNDRTPLVVFDSSGSMTREQYNVCTDQVINEFLGTVRDEEPDLP